jgi:hypothetical protein
MIYTEVNDLLRIISRKIISMGFKKTAIGRIIFGASSYPMFNRFIDEDKEQDFGIKPLMRAADVLGYEVRVVFVDPEKEETIVEEIKMKNREFAIELENYLVEYLSNAGEEKKTRETTLDKAIDNLLGL